MRLEKRSRKDTPRMVIGYHVVPSTRVDGLSTAAFIQTDNSGFSGGTGDIGWESAYMK